MRARHSSSSYSISSAGRLVCELPHRSTITSYTCRASQHEGKPRSQSNHCSTLRRQSEIIAFDNQTVWVPASLLSILNKCAAPGLDVVRQRHNKDSTRQVRT